VEAVRIRDHHQRGEQVPSDGDARPVEPTAQAPRAGEQGSSEQS